MKTCFHSWTQTRVAIIHHSSASSSSRPTHPVASHHHIIIVLSSTIKPIIHPQHMPSIIMIPIIVQRVNVCQRRFMFQQINLWFVWWKKAIFSGSWTSPRWWWRSAENWSFLWISSLFGPFSGSLPFLKNTNFLLKRSKTPKIGWFQKFSADLDHHPGDGGDLLKMENFLRIGQCGAPS